MRLLRLPACEGCDRVMSFGQRHHLNIHVEVVGRDTHARRFPVLVTDEGVQIEGLEDIMRYLGRLVSDIRK